MLIALTSVCEPTHASRAMFVTIDSMATVTVCLAARHRIGSYHAVLTWDTSAATFESVGHPQRGIFAEDTDRPGRVDFAGSTGTGFDSGAVLTVRLRPKEREPKARLNIAEMADVRGRDLIPARGPEPHIESITPDTLALGSTAPVTIHGRHFAADSNRVQVGPARIGPVPSSEHGSVLSIVVPAVLPSSGEAPPFKLGPSTYRIRITTRAGSSNLVPFTLVERAP